MSVVQYSFCNGTTILRRIIGLLRETCANLRERATLYYMFAAGSFALPRVELRRELRCEVQNRSSVKSSLLVGRSTMPCQQTLLLLAGGLNLGSCPYRILHEILRKLAWDLGSCFLLGAYQQ